MALVAKVSATITAPTATGSFAGTYCDDYYRYGDWEYTEEIIDTNGNGF